MCPATAALFIATGLLQGAPDRTRFRCATCAKCARRAASIWFVRNRQIVRAFKKRRQRGRLRHPALKDKTYAKVCELALPMVPLVGWMMLQFHFWAPEAEFHCADRLHSAAWALILPSCFLGAPSAAACCRAADLRLGLTGRCFHARPMLLLRAAVRDIQRLLSPDDA